MKKIFLGLVLVMAAYSQSYAQERQKEVQDYVQMMDEVLHETMNFENSSSWFLQKVRVRVNLEYGIEIPVLAKFALKPEIELFFEK